MSDGLFKMPISNEALRAISLFLGTGITLRLKRPVDYDELFIFLGLGRLNLGHPDRELLDPIVPINAVALSNYLNMPRETVRRKLIKLERLGFVISHASGYVVTDARAFERLCEALVVRQ